MGVLTEECNAAAHNLTSVDALREGMQEKSEEFKKAGEIYLKR